MRKEISDLKTNKEDVTETMKKFTDFQDIIEKTVTKSGWVKSGDEASPWNFIIGAVNENLPKLISGFQEMQKNKQQQPQVMPPDNPPQQMPPQPNPPQQTANPGSVEKSLDHRDAGGQPPAPAPTNINPDIAPPPMSDEEYARSHDLSEVDYDSPGEEMNNIINQSLGVGKFSGLAPTSTVS